MASGTGPARNIGRRSDMLKEARRRLMPNALLATVVCTVKAGPRRGMNDRAKCPVCVKGWLRFAVNAKNGHIHCVCTTPTCIMFVQ